MAHAGQVDLSEPGAADCSQVNPAGVILAAGASRRMGTPKALLDFHGRTFLERSIELLRPHCAPLIVVLGHDAERIAARCPATALLVRNPEPDRGMLSSLQCALRTLPGAARAFVFTPVDLPAIGGETVARVIDAFVCSGGHPPVRFPRYQGRRGHPVCVSWELVGDLLRLDHHQAARDVLGRHTSEAAHVDVTDAGIVTDADSPEDYRRLLALSHE